MKQYILWSKNSWLKNRKITKDNYQNNVFLEKIYLILGENKKAELLEKRNNRYLKQQ